MSASYDFVLSQNQVAVDALAAHTGLSKMRIKDAMNKGACWWVQKGKQVRLRRASKALLAGTRLQLYYDEAILAREPQAAQLLDDAQRYSAWYKPHGTLAQGSQWGDHCSLLRWVELNIKRPCFLVHRLDADAAGLMLIAHDAQAAASLSQLLQGRSIDKYYLARVQGRLQAQALRLDAAIDGKEAISWVDTLQWHEPSVTSLVRVKIDTGRKHQIRRHLADHGHPIVGDRLYGKAAPQPLQLLAYQLNFTCPLRKRAVSLVLPEALQQL